MKNQIKDVVTRALIRVISVASGLNPPPSSAVPPFVQDAIDQAIAEIEPLTHRAAPCHKFCEATSFNIEIRQLKARIAELEAAPAIAALIDIAGTVNKTATDKQFIDHLQGVAKQALADEYKRSKTDYSYDDWYLVPGELTDEMSNAVHDVMIDHRKNGRNDEFPNFYEMWNDLIASAPKHPLHFMEAITSLILVIDSQRKESECIPRMREALERISRWHGEFPEAFDRDGKASTYGSLYGSNGEREYMRNVASNALAAPVDECDHDWVDATNSRVSGTDVCLKCKSVRAQKLQ